MTTLKESQYIDYLAHMLDEAMLTEGKHWPKDYKNTAFNTIKSSELGKQDWYLDDFIRQDIDTIASDFTPIAHRNSNLGYFAAVIRWFCQYAGADRAKYQEFIERKLDTVIQYLQLFVNDGSLVEKYRDDVKQKFSYQQFIDLMKPVSDKMKQDADNAEFKVVDKGYEIIPIMSYQELHKQFGGRKTGYKGDSEWCHTNGKSTYESWTSNYTRFFFVLTKNNWKEILPPDPVTANAYDEYGTSLMAILVSDKGELLACTLRWNHVIDPAATKPGRTVDKAFISFAELSQVTGLDIKAEIDAMLQKMLKKLDAKHIRGKLVYKDSKCRCYATDKLTWYDNKNNEIPPLEKVEKPFICKGTGLTSLAGSPREAVHFDCSTTRITSLAGAPRVALTFNCCETQLTSLAGGPEVVDYYTCGGQSIDNASLASFDGAPEKVQSFTCMCAQLTSLEGIPSVSRSVNVYLCPQLTSLAGIKLIFDKNKTTNSVSISHCDKLASLNGLPDVIYGNFNCWYNGMNSLKGCPKKIYGHAEIAGIDITDLEGGPTFVKKTLSLSGLDKLRSLKGAPGKCNEISFGFMFPKDKINAYLEWKEMFGTRDNNYPG